MKKPEFRYQLQLAAVLFSCLFTSISGAQTLSQIDTTFGTGGKVETTLSQFGDEITDLNVYMGGKITVCGKVGTSDTTLKRFGMIRLNPDGSFDETFGKNGKTIVSWESSDYPNAVIIPVDSSIMCVGAGASVSQNKIQTPAVFRFTKNGEPDSTFAGDGHKLFGYDTKSAGEFTTIYAEGGSFLACGAITSVAGNSSSGFYAIRVLPNGDLDTSFGTAGKGFIPANVHSAFGFLTVNTTVTFIGLMDTGGSSRVVFARLTPQGLPDPSFGTNGLLMTSVSVLAGRILSAAMQQDYKIVAALPPQFISPSVPFAVVRFLTTGRVDSTYATNGIAQIAFSPGVATSRGINVANNGKTVVSGSADFGLGQCATARLNVDGSPDLTFNLSGHAVLDVDSGSYPNYLLRFTAIGQKRYIGYGGSIHNTKKEFLIARFHDVAPSSVHDEGADEGCSLQIIPNPVQSVCSIRVCLGTTAIKIIDAMGHEQITITLRGPSSLYSVDVTRLLNGVYYCIANCSGKEAIQKFIVTH
jgi:uncharacterized delta-60 repeat protein